MITGNKIVLINKSRNVLRYERNGEVINVDSRRLPLRTRAQRDVIWLLLSSLGKTVSHVEIADLLNRIGGPGSRSDNPSARSAKFIASLRDHLEELDELRGLIESQRAHGYIVGSNWSSQPLEIQIEKTNDFLGMLDSVVSDCIEHTNSRPVIHCANGLQFVDFDMDFALQKYEVLNAMLWDTIRILSATAKPSDITPIKDQFHKLASYVLYWRLGDGLTDEKWKRDYCDEILSISDQIKTIVDKLLPKIM
jgi:hypothetical protein